jgi:hypothetical protein
MATQKASDLFPVSLLAKNNLADLASVSAALTALGLGTTAAAELARIGAAAQDDVRQLMIQVARVQGRVAGYASGFADDYADQSGVDAVSSSGQFYDPLNKLYYNTDPYTKALLHFEGANGSTVFSDDAGHTCTGSGGATISTAQAKFGTGSGIFTGSAAGIQAAASADWAPGTSDFTVEGWVYLTANTAATAIFADFRTGATSGNISVLFSAGKFGYFNPVSGASYLGSVTLATGQWYHIALVRTSGTIKTYINGTLDLSQADATNWNVSAPLTIGNRFDFGYVLSGYLDEFRFSNGLARYTANFTPSTTALALSPTALDLRSVAVPASFVPNKAGIFIPVKPLNGGTITPNTNLIASVSRTRSASSPTWTPVTLVAAGTVGGFAIYEANGVDLSGQPSGQSMGTRLQTSGGLAIQAQADVMQWAA